MKIRPFAREDVESIVTLHLQNLPCTVSSRIGKEYLRRLYNGLLTIPDQTLLVAEEKKKLFGVITATPNLAVTSASLTSLLYPKSLMLLGRSIFSRRIGIAELFNQILFEKKLISQFDTPYPTILTLFVNQSVQQKGIGKQLVSEVKNIFRKKKLKRFYVDTEEKNMRAQGFYEHIDGKKIATLHGSIVYEFILERL